MIGIPSGVSSIYNTIKTFASSKHICILTLDADIQSSKLAPQIPSKILLSIYNSSLCTYYIYQSFFLVRLCLLLVDQCIHVERNKIVQATMKIYIFNIINFDKQRVSLFSYTSHSFPSSPQVVMNEFRTPSFLFFDATTLALIASKEKGKAAQNLVHVQTEATIRKVYQ